ncbi:GNAT family N-acetyltransferase [Streptomyces sp. NRRL F-5123]|uniref:GNAT family N-acetyltransferase n=1 Tax=Streptomyces sp. NRRL F-5123 TaxID=1463856 RepID=UPI00099CCB44|nr:GNAT family N-acetyltransferase [Streptomyces sp. NRRL F-5123]
MTAPESTTAEPPEPAAPAEPAPAGPGTPAPARFVFRPVDPGADAALLHRWVVHPKASFWLMGDATREDVERAYAEIAAAPYEDAFLGLHGGEPVCVMERYDPARVELAGLYPAEPGDVGMHFLVAPADAPVHGFTRAVIRAVLAELFADPATRRVVVEPDVRNTAVHRLNATVGFEIVGTVVKPEKDALLSICTRERFEATR